MDIFEKINKAQADNGKPAWKQIIELVKLRLAREPIGIGEYFDYGIYRKSITATKVREFIGWRKSASLDTRLNNNWSRVLANDKLLNYLVLHAIGHPIPEPIATYSPTGRRISNEKVLQTLDEVRAFLNGDPYPFYVKPISAGYGRGVRGVERREGNQLHLLDGKQISIDQFLKPFAFSPFQGMLVQKPLVAHPAITTLTGSSAICCVRFICFVTPHGPTIHTAFWKVVVGSNMLDNFSHGTFGNCLASIGVDDGKVKRAISKMGPGGEIDRHPSTGKQLVGFKLPDWDESVKLVLSASGQFPGLNLQNWDVALCPQGPVLLELNTESELAVPQAISGEGFMDQRLRDIVAEHAREEILYRQSMEEVQNIDGIA